MAKRDENNNIIADAKRNINEIYVEYYINNVKHILEPYSNINKDKLLSIGDFLKLLIENNINGISINLLREWGDKELLPAYRVEKGKIRTESRYYLDEHLEIVKEIKKLKSYGLEMREIEKIIFYNQSFEILLLSKIIKNKEVFIKMKNIIDNIEKKENDLIVSVCKLVKEFFNIKDVNFNDTFNEEYIEKIVQDIKNSNKINDSNILLLSLMLLSVYSCYHEENLFDNDKFNKLVLKIMNAYKIHT